MPNSYEVLKIVSGESIPEGPDGDIGEQTKAVLCSEFVPSETTWYAYNSSDDTQDYFICLHAN